ncbi:hypothetical protein PTTG_25489 [Puccinia triticina 1-1 BBBD Race 1]|uniref:Uncharacterized protein n=1 Tax=Puccinia triticina (isolate 1-1 / race 1 (BBBD)) TaxID=630390 RepID=A0A180H122_PUCT1|nr:hypothetical protein PTTG_25489 [Puccinia triticina 1-1 BBBD Race 1]
MEDEILAKPYLRPGSSTPFAGHTSHEFFRHKPAQFPAGGYEQIDWSAGGGAVSLQKSAGAYGGGTVYGSAYGGSATLDCQPLVYPPSHSSFNPYHSFASLVEPTPAYPLLAKRQPALGEFQSFSMPPAEQQAYQHSTNFAPSAAGASRAASQQQYTETDGYGRPASTRPLLSPECSSPLLPMPTARARSSGPAAPDGSPVSKQSATACPPPSSPGSPPASFATRPCAGLARPAAPPSPKQFSQIITQKYSQAVWFCKTYYFPSDKDTLIWSLTFCVDLSLKFCVDF